MKLKNNIFWFFYSSLVSFYNNLQVIMHSNNYTSNIIIFIIQEQE